MWPVILVFVLGVVATVAVCVFSDRYDRFPLTAAAAIVTILATSLAWLVTETVYERAAFVASTECMAKRMEPVRQMLSSRVVCVPAYRATKNDTLTANVNTR